ncbi:MAG: TlpA disulfide reductase family protein [Bacteroidota bacterium]|nr:TlpA disulfide reductase family protein [Bacteroidota bacterium]
MKKIIILALLTSSVFALQSFKQTKRLPDVRLKDINGFEKNVSDYGKTGRITIISLWATWCKPCIQEINAINDLMDTWKTKYNVDLVAVSVDDGRTAPKVKPFVASQGWDFDILLDPSKELQQKLSVPSVPYLILVDKNGNIVDEHNGYLAGDEFQLEEKLKKLTGQ